MNMQRILMIVVALILLGGGYYYYQVYRIAPSTAGGSAIIAELDAAMAEIRPLGALDLNISILDNDFFQSLKPIIASTSSAVTAGRDNPFLPF